MEISIHIIHGLFDFPPMSCPTRIRIYGLSTYATHSTIVCDVFRENKCYHPDDDVIFPPDENILLNIWFYYLDR